MKFAKRVAATADSGLEDLDNDAEASVIPFAGGYPDPAVFPQADLQRAFKTATTQPALLQYATTAGYAPLRARLAQWLTEDGIPSKTEDVLMTQGAQQGIDLTAKLLLDKGDGLVVEAPTYLGALAAFNAYEPTYYEVPMQQDGLDIERLKQILAQHQIKMLYTVPDFQNPTGTVMSVAKRKALVALANQYDFVIVEDGPYRQLRYTGEDVPPIKHFDTQGRVVFLGSMSKIIAPGLRVGWMIAAPAMLEAMSVLKDAADVESSALVMASVDTYLSKVDFSAHIAALRQHYATKRDAMIRALDATMPPSVHYTRPAGGFFLWLTAPGIDMANLAQTALPEAGVTIVPSVNLAPSHAIKNGARITFAAPPLAQIKPGVNKLAQVLKQALAK